LINKVKCAKNLSKILNLSSPIFCVLTDIPQFILELLKNGFLDSFQLIEFQWFTLNFYFFSF